MLLTVFCLRRDRSEVTFSLQVDADFELQNFRALCELESGIPAAESQLVYAEVPLTDNRRSLASYGLKDGDVVILQQVDNGGAAAPFPGLPRIDFSSITVPGTSAQAAQLPPQQPAPPPRASPPEGPPIPQGLDNPALLRDMLLANPHELSLLKERNPPLAEALLSGDLEKFSQVLVEQQQDRARREQERIRLFSADPFDLEAQAKIEEDIRQQNIEENMTIAMEEAPESFGQVVMLYINCKVNGHPVKAFVDSGAQMTIMSQACAERCNIMRLVDRRWAGIAKGVGTQKIIGRVHLAQVQIEGDFLPCSFSILEEQPMDMLLGLDMLKRHQCSIDLKKNVLVIGTTGSQTTFLPEGELPECARLAYGAGREDVRPEEIADQELAEAIQKSVQEAENTDKEATSPEMSLLPSSDGFKCPVRFPETGVEISKSFSRPLDRSVSAPTLGSPKRSLAEAVCPRAAKSVGSLPGWPATPGREDLPLPLLDLSDRDASLAGTELPGRPDSPSLKTCAKPAASGDPQPSGAKGGRGPRLESPLQGAEGRRLPGAAAAAALLPPLRLGRGLAGPKLLSEEPGLEQPLDEQQKAAGTPEDLSAPGAPPPPTKGGLAPGGKVRFSPEGAPRAEPAAHLLPAGNETIMEVEAPGQAFMAAGERLEEQNVTCSALNNAECSMMEAEPSKSDSSLSVEPLSASGWKLSGRTALESANPSAAGGFSGSPPPAEGQLSRPGGDSGCPSLASALKELHQLLVASYQEAAGDEESLAQLGTLPGEETTGGEIFGGKQHECPGGSLSSSSSFPAGVPEEASVGVPPLAGAGAEDGQDALELEHKGARITEAPLGLESSVPRPSTASCDSPAGAECSGAFPLSFSSGQTAGNEAWGQNPPPSRLDLGESLRVLHFPPGEPGTPVSSTGAQHSCSPEIDSAAPQPPLVDPDELVRAGFTPQEASEALARAGGNVDLALLLLLAQKIVVPT
ncbi:protein DDI1 homolog 2 [Heteronotia binoei]|uniref:protein DDI1 homolog 2 n=1 Tax=Heteronotia binoei TaxID=13085 RepID=UPI0029301944|nr:protein DDI1 homolog 2 [Heteronotia binoei]